MGPSHLVITIPMRNHDVTVKVVCDSDRSGEECNNFERIESDHGITISGKAPVVNTIDDVPNYPIAIYPGNEVPHILLLEETRYWIKVEGCEGDALPYLSKFKARIEFNRNPFENKMEFTINFRDYIGRGFIDVVEDGIHKSCPIEVRSKKIGYFKDYKKMIHDIEESQCGQLLDSRSPLFQAFDTVTTDDATPYQEFMVLDYMFGENDFENQFEIIKSETHGALKNSYENVPASCAYAIDPMDIPGLLAPWNLMQKDGGAIAGMYSPVSVRCTRSTMDRDTPENRFIRFFVRNVSDTVNRLINDKELTRDNPYIEDRLRKMRDTIRDVENDRWFEGIGNLHHVPYQSTALRKKRGYGRMFMYHNMLGRSSKLTDDVFTDLLRGHMLKLSELYEIWCFTKLIEILNNCTQSDNPIECKDYQIQQREQTSSEDIEEELHHSKNDISESLSAGKFHIRTKGSDYLDVNLYYKKEFNQEGKVFHSSSLDMTPDYTMVVIQRDSGKTTPAERISVINLDAKYKVERGKVKNDDIQKMNCYHDSILFSNGSIVLYPGEKDEEVWYSHLYSSDNNENKRNRNLPAVGSISLNPAGSDMDHITEVFRKILKSNMISEGTIWLEPEL